MAEAQHPLLESLAAQISSCVADIAAYSEKSGHGHVSFQPDSPATLLPAAAPEQLHKSQQTLLDSIFKLNLLATDVAGFLPQHQVHYQALASLRWLVHFKIPSLIPPADHVSYHDLAVAANVPELYLRRIAAMAMSVSFLQEDPAGHLSHTRLSARFGSEELLGDWLSFMTTLSMPTALRLVEATPRPSADSLEASSTGHTAYSIAMGTDRNFFEDLKANPERGRLFASYMKGVGRGKATSVEHLVRGFDWEVLGDGATVVDVGGSSGHASIALAQSFPTLKFVVQDTPPVIAESLKSFAASDLPSPIKDRVTFQAHDFMTPQPIVGKSVYLLRTVLHDWPDTECVTILWHLADALGVDGRILIMDTVLPAHERTRTLEQAGLMVRDLTMLEVFGSKERDEEDWEKLIHAVGKGLAVRQVLRPVGSALAIIEVVKGNGAPN